MASAAGPNLEIEGLILSLDAANTNSYSGSGTTWVDMIDSSNNDGTLTNGPTFDSESGGCIVLDGSNDFVLFSTDANVYINTGTCSVWVKPTSNNSGYRGVIVKQNNWGIFVKDNKFVTYSWVSVGGQLKDTGITVGNGNWCNLTMSFNNTAQASPSNNVVLYLNGDPVLTTSVKRNHNNTRMVLGSGTDGSGSQFLSGKISSALLYDRVLTASEVKQNYNSHKGRFGL